MKAKLFAMPASHPSLAAALMLERKRIEYRVVWLLLPVTGPALRLRWLWMRDDAWVDSLATRGARLWS